MKISTTEAKYLFFVFSPTDVSIGEKKLSSILGELIWEEISQCIINECLLHSIPDNSSQLEEYSAVRVKQQLICCASVSSSPSCRLLLTRADLFLLQVIRETGEFETSLKDMEFLQGDSTDLLKYARDVNCHFATKKCKDVIVAARKLMTSQMHITVKVCASEPKHFLSHRSIHPAIHPSATYPAIFLN